MARKDRFANLNVKEYPARDKRYQETVVFVPYFGGSQRHIQRHIRLINELGFDAVGFDLSFRDRFVLKHIPISKTHDWGIMHLWADEIHYVLETIPGPKHIFSFSNPTASLLKAITLIKKRDDIKSLVCDGGPFQKLFQCVWNLAKHEYKIKSRFARLWLTSGMLMFWAPDHKKTLEKSVMSLPPGFPVLSIRAWKDELVPVDAIEKAFEPGVQLDLRTFELPEAHHLTGLKDAPKLYKEKVETFLKEFSTEV